MPMEHAPDNLAVAPDAHAKALAATPCHPGTHAPAVTWQRWQTELPPSGTLRPVEPIEDADVMVRRARAYIAHVEGAISGQRGHDRTMRMAGILIQKFGLSIEQAWPLILEWNRQCEPPWSERELLHKLQD